MSVELLLPSMIGDAVRAEWRALEAAPEEPANPFFTSWFLEPALRCLADDEVRLLTIRADDQRLIGLAPVIRGRTYAKIPAAHFSTWRHFHGYNNCAPLFAKGAEERGREALSRWIDGRPEGARFFRFMEHPLRENDSLIRRDDSRAVVIQKDGRRAVLRAGRSFDEVYGDGFCGKKRKELRRQLRRLGECGAVCFVRWTDAADIARAAPEHIALELAGWKGRAGAGRPIGASAAERAFFVEAMTAGAMRGAVLCDALMLDGRAIATLFSLRTGRTLMAYKIAYDEACATYSPGVQLLVEATRLMLEDPLTDLFDSGTHPDHPIMDHLWRERMRVAQVNISSAHAVDRQLLRACRAMERLKARVTTPSVGGLHA